MKKEHIVIIILSIVIVVMGVAWIINSQPKGKKWVTVGSWSGTQRDYDMTTEQFVISGEEWRISWGSSQVVGGSGFHIVVYDVYTGNVVKEISTSAFQNPSGESYFNTKGRFYVEISILGDLGSWRVYVQEYK